MRHPLRAQVALVLVGHVRGYVSNDKVPEPIGSRGHRDTFCSNWKREDFTDHYPRGGTLSRGEKRNVDADEDNKDVTGRSRARSGSTNDGDNEFTNSN